MNCGTYSRLLLLFALFFYGCSTSRQTSMKSNSSSHHADTTFLPQIFAQNPAYFKNIVSNLDEYRVQVIYTEIDRKAGGRPVFHDHYFNVSDSNFYYPASTVKLPASIPFALNSRPSLDIFKVSGSQKRSSKDDSCMLRVCLF